MRLALAAAIGMLFGCNPRPAQSVDPASSNFAPPGEIVVAVTRVDRSARMRTIHLEVRSSPDARPVEYTGQIELIWLETQVLRDVAWVTTTNHGHCGTGVEQRVLRPGERLSAQESFWMSEGGPVRVGFMYREADATEDRIVWGPSIE